VILITGGLVIVHLSSDAYQQKYSFLLPTCALLNSRTLNEGILTSSQQNPIFSI